MLPAPSPVASVKRSGPSMRTAWRSTARPRRGPPDCRQSCSTRKSLPWHRLTGPAAAGDRGRGRRIVGPVTLLSVIPALRRVLPTADPDASRASS